MGTPDEGSDARRDAPVDPASHRPRGLPWRIRMIVVFAVVVVILLIVFIPVRLTSASAYCTSCHAMKAAAQSWSHSVHAKVPCVQCHIKPGVYNGIVWRVQEAKNIWSSYLDAGKGMVASVQRPDSTACERCHALRNLPAVVGGIRISHGSHLTMHDLACADCHYAVSHAPAGQAAQVSMSVCTMCHNGRATSNACSTCHTTPPPDKPHPANFVATHGQQVLGHEPDCLRCHHDKAQFCDACHARPPASHFSGTWRYTHAAQARTNDIQCMGCHNRQTFCQQCHQVDHPADWATSHAAVARRGTVACLVCHPQTMCTGCHESRGVRP